MSIWKDETESKALWHLERSRGIGGSEIAIIMGLSPYTSANELWLEKSGQIPQKDLSRLPHIQRGVQGEKVCRMLLEQETATSWTPKTWTIPGTIFRCSDDGYSLDRNEILEIKCMGLDNHTRCQTQGYIPPHYVLQCEWALMCSGATLCRFISFRPETNERAEVIVYPDPSKWQAMKDAALEFWEHVQNKTPPGSTTDTDAELIDDEEFRSWSLEWLELKVAAKDLAEKIDILEEKLKGYMPEIASIMNEYVAIKRSTRVGAIDYRRLVADHKIDPEPYRKPRTPTCTIDPIG